MRPRKHPVQEFLGVRYYRKPSGYFKSDFYEHGGKYMHRVVWECSHGAIPAGHHVHHVNGDKADNRLDNLQLKAASGHIADHVVEQYASGVRRPEDAFSVEARRAAAAWHGTEAGRDAARRGAAASWASRSVCVLRCAHCGSEFSGRAGAAKRGFCGPACQSAARRASRVDHVERACSVCGGAYQTDRYRGRRTCSTACASEAISRARRRPGVRPGGG